MVRSPKFGPDIVVAVVVDDVRVASHWCLYFLQNRIFRNGDQINFGRGVVVWSVLLLLLAAWYPQAAAAPTTVRRFIQFARAASEPPLQGSFRRCHRSFRCGHSAAPAVRDGRRTQPGITGNGRLIGTDRIQVLYSRAMGITKMVVLARWRL